METTVYSALVKTVSKGSRVSASETHGSEGQLHQWSLMDLGNLIFGPVGSWFCSVDCLLEYGGCV